MTLSVSINLWHHMLSGPYQALRWTKRMLGLVHSQISLLRGDQLHHRYHQLHPYNFVEL